MSISTLIAPIYDMTYNLGNSLEQFDNNQLAENLSINYFYISANNTSENITNYQTLDYLNNSDFSGAEESELKKRTFAEIFLVSLALGSLILATVIGNIFVISAIILEKNLKSVGNYLVLSLAVTDLMVACLVMPLGAVYEITQEWTLGSSLCELWTCTDVLCCTASILHLLAIACDRFWAVTNVDYVHQRNGRHIGCMIAAVWIVSAIISLAPILGWKDSDFERRILENRCLVSQDISYQVFATMISFYGPSALVLILYYRIYLVAKKRIRRKSSSAVKAKGRRPHSCPPVPNTYISATEMTTMTYNMSSSNGSNASSDNSSGNSYQILVLANSRHLLFPPHPFQAVTLTAATPSVSANGGHTVQQDFMSGASTSDCLEQLDVPSMVQKDSNSSNSNNVSFDSTNLSNGQSNGGSKSKAQPLKRLKFRRKCINEREVENKRERKAAKTLAIITGIFIVCWLPFFVVALIMPLCPQCVINPYLFSFCLWLGWTNSSLNPFLYTIFSPDFRSAFRRMIFGRKNRKR